MAKILMIQTQPAPCTGIAYLNGAATSHGHSFALCLGTGKKAILQAIVLHKPDLIGFSCLTGLHIDILKISHLIKDHFKIPIIIGGPHPTFFPEMINNDAVDIICRGEGEFALIDLLNAITRKAEYTNIPNLWVKQNNKIYRNPPRPLANPLNTVPMIDWSCYKNTVVANSSPIAFPIRGCPYSCSYCFNAAYRELYHVSSREYIRQFSVERAIAEVQEAIKVFAKNPVLFTSDTMGVDIDWMENFFAQYAQTTPLPFVLLLRPELVSDRVIAIIKKYRCHSIAIGVESGSERVRREVLNRHYPNKMLLDIAEKLHQAGIKFRTYNMFGIPTESLDEMWETVTINTKMKTDFPRGAIFTPMPGVPLTDFAKSRGYLDTSFSFDHIPTTILDKTILNNVDRSMIQNMLYFFQSAIIFPRAQAKIKKLMRTRPNILFKLWFYLIYLVLHRRSEGRRWPSYIKYVLANSRYR